jgi:betaine-aldehyde dehydrogenase
MVEDLRNFVGGQETDFDYDKRLDLINPSTGEVFATAPISSEAEVTAAFAAASDAFEGWRDKTPSERSLALLRIADTLEQHAEQLVQAECQNTGKPIALTMSEEIPPMIDQIRFFAGAARMLEGRSAGEYMSGFTSFIRREPVGVCAAVTPWNYPMMMATWKWAPALAAGNTMVLKPSDTTPASTLLMAQLMSEHLPPGVFNVVCGDRDTGRVLVSHPVPQMVSITGSVRAGREVAAAAGEKLKRTHLELGGKAPVVVFDDADPAKAAEAIAIAGYFNAGQDCTAATRVLTAPGVHDGFVEALVEQARGQTVGGPDVPDADFGPLNNASQLERVSGFIQRLPDHAHVLTGGHRIGDRGYFYEPSVVDGLLQDDEIIQNEVFGPVITVQRFSDEDEAVRWANGTEYGLASSIWTSNHARAMRVSRRLDFGCVWINTHIPLVAEMPHGGFKQSGHGKDLSMYGFEDYTRVKHVMSALD